MGCATGVWNTLRLKYHCHCHLVLYLKYISASFFPLQYYKDHLQKFNFINIAIKCRSILFKRQSNPDISSDIFSWYLTMFNLLLFRIPIQEGAAVNQQNYDTLTSTDFHRIDVVVSSALNRVAVKTMNYKKNQCCHEYYQIAG